MPTGQVASTEMSSSGGKEVPDRKAGFILSPLLLACGWPVSLCIPWSLLVMCKASELWHLISCSSLSSSCEFVLACVRAHVHVEVCVGQRLSCSMLFFETWSLAQPRAYQLATVLGSEPWDPPASAYPH